jgi:hypothetical protein
MDISWTLSRRRTIMWANRERFDTKESESA